PTPQLPAVTLPTSLPTGPSASVPPDPHPAGPPGRGAAAAPLLTEPRDLDPAWATAARRAAFPVLTAGSGRDGGCLRVVRGRPASEQRAQAQRLVGQLPMWVAQGFPAADASELQAPVVPIAQARARLDASRCR
ncbi:MAG: hypothetical protein M3Q47_05620, partial [Actinomycetota bacterium]|nr:hypothetical protein [Actinomycetota bacterium]